MPPFVAWTPPTPEALALQQGLDNDAEALGLAHAPPSDPWPVHVVPAPGHADLPPRVAERFRKING